jgi:hypothetical protein
MKVFILFSLLFVTLSARAKINWKECDRLYDGIYKDGASKDSNVVLRALNNALAAMTTGGPSSSSSYVSSSGKCKGTAQIEFERYEFVFRASGALDKQIAQGGGDYVEALAFLYGCEPQASRLAGALRANFGAVFENPDPKNTVMAIEHVISSDHDLAARCEI